AYRPESAFVLRGVVVQGEEAIALVEDTRSGVTSRARVGDSVADGRISGITLDAIVYEKDGQSAEIALGRRLGEAPSTQPSVEGSGGEALAGSEPARESTGSSGTTGEGALSILERLRQRRLKELEKP
ncbi:MAG: hypothetical protein V2A58_10285, partial [Planctomycetota bacterium]